MSYLAIKHIHLSLAVLTFAFFLLRSFWSIQGSALLQHKVVRALPHMIDTCLLLCGLWLASIIGFNHPFIFAKIVGLLLYIVFGTIAIKRGKTKGQKILGLLLATLAYAYIIGCAFTKSPLSWLTWL
ncbi:SirB2 family protein [Brackiella oedipodis]|uniref:SirB2 family protein n=1 Tax=Brackiella oedipodis TaxID=124225 RepID=UPI00048E76B3|nr:SirB2 family protein [Brackiella oedipodis]